MSEEAKGPPEGAPDAALEGFCRKNGVTKDQLELRDVKGRSTWFAVMERPGRATKAVLADAVPAIVRDFAWPKSMRWGAASLSTESPRWVRPLSGIVAILGEQLVECEAAGICSGYATLGHRFHCPGEITIGGADHYAEKLRACHVIVDHEERATLIREGARKAAAEAGLALVDDEGLVIENAGLTEWPVPLLGRFDEDFLDVPPEVIQLTARVNQKYFVCHRSPAKAGASGSGAQPHEVPASAGNQELANAFICTANIAAVNGGAAIVDGNRKVLAARLSDARFFWEQDRKKTLAEHAEGLARITFHEKLGTVADKAERVAKLARWLVTQRIVTPAKAGVHRASRADGEMDSGLRRNDEEVANLANLAEQAARLCKADLVTEMVGEFPELQGVMGGYYARAEGLPDQVADAIRDHYKPVGQGDEVPTAPVTVAVSLADKLDTLAGFFVANERPTGSKDPFALRRAALGIVRLLLENSLRANLTQVVMRAMFGNLGYFYAQDNSAVLRKTQSALELVSDASVAKSVLDDVIRQYQHTDSTGSLPIKQSDREYAAINLELAAFLIDRLKVQQREAGVRHDLIDAVFALGGEDDLVRLLERVKALQNYIETAEGADLLAAYKRAANILKKEGWSQSTSVTPAKAGVHRAPGADGEMDSGLRRNDEGETEQANDIPRTGEEDPLALVDDPDLMAVIAAKMADARAKKELSYTPEPAEKNLIAALDSAEPKAAAAGEAEDFEGAMAALASLRAPIDTFFDEVTVNDGNEHKRTARLDLLLRFRDAVHSVADFSRVEG